MNDELTVVLRELVRGRKIAALGTLHQGAPFVSMVPFALAKDGSLIVHVSRLASHTQDMLEHPDVSLLITESE
jgi:putative heme iron utilization protein